MATTRKRYSGLLKVFAVWASGAWREELEAALGPVAGWAIPILLAYIPGLVIGFMLFTLAVLAIIFAPAILKQARVRQPSPPVPAVPTTPSALSIPEKSIAVLPFENRSDEKENAYFADGIEDEILTRLSNIADLKVISRTSTRQYQSKPANLREIAKQLGVANILEGSVQKAADQVRVNVQLINAQTDSHLWAETYDRKLTDIFSVESEIAKGIAESLQAKLTGREEQALAVKPTNNPEAYDAYLRGLSFEARLRSSQVGSSWEAAGFFERAVQLDPNFGLAWARLSRADAQLCLNGIDRRDADAARPGGRPKTALLVERVVCPAPHAIVSNNVPDEHSNHFDLPYGVD